VHPADVQDRDGGVLVLKTRFGLHPFLKNFSPMAVSGTQLPGSPPKKALSNMTTEIVKRSDQTRGFETLPRR
jgi:hypothetical protein